MRIISADLATDSYPCMIVIGSSLDDLASEPLEVQVVEQLERGVMPVVHTRRLRQLPQPRGHQVAYMVQGLKNK